MDNNEFKRRIVICAEFLTIAFCIKVILYLIELMFRYCL